ncbi:MAG: nuclear transport factor 2 family protein [Magnetovibrionaceae bacterium]
MNGDDQICRTALQGYADFFERLTPSNLCNLTGLVTPDVRFKDPFNDLTGPEGMVAVFQHMFDTVEEPRFAVRAKGLDRQCGLLLWTMTFRTDGKPMRIEGMSEVRLTADGLVSAHIDHWDAAEQVFGKVPVLGGLLRWIGKRLSVSQPARARPIRARDGRPR